MKCMTDRNYTTEYDVGILGYWFNKNYGAVLTTYALYKAVEQCGYNPVLLDIPLAMEKIEGNYTDDTEAGRQFIAQNCNVSERYTHRFQLSNLNQKCESFLVGSDQLWHTCRNQYRNKGGEFFLDFVDDCKKKLSYATSFGDDEFKGSGFDKRILSKLLHRFDGISVREKSARDICKNIFGVEAEVLPDPIFLHDKEFFEELSEKKTDSDRSREYILAYLLHPTEEKQELIKKIAENYGMELVVIPDANDNYKKYDGCAAWTVNIEENTTIPNWLSYFNNAKYVITDSYHGVVLSVVFEKAFLGLYPRNGIDRFVSLAKMLKIEDRVCFWGTSEQATELMEKPIDYEQIALALKAEKSKAWKWLDENLSKKKIVEDISDIEVERYRYDTVAAALSRSVNARLVQHTTIFERKNKRLENEIMKNRKLLLGLFFNDVFFGKKVLIRGAGRHTTELLKLLPSACEVLGIVAKEQKMKSIEGMKVYNDFAAFDEKDVDYVIISSYRYAKEMEEELEGTRYEQKIFNMYTELSKKGITLGKEFYQM